MRWAYSGSMRPKFKVLACEAFRAELSALQLKSGFWSRCGIRATNRIDREANGQLFAPHPLSGTFVYLACSHSAYVAIRAKRRDRT